MSSQPDAGRIMRTLCAFQQTEALKAAIELGVFTHIASGATTAAELAKRIGASERGVRILCDFLTVEEYLTKTNGAYANSATANAFLNQHSPAYIGAMAGFLSHKSVQRDFRDMAGAVRRGGAALKTMIEPDSPIWVEFARSMSGFLGMVASFNAKALARPGEPQKVLDIAAGHGMFGLMIAKANPAAEIYAVDWAPVLEVAKENAAKLGLADRFHTIPGSAFQVDLGNGYDLILIPNFLHHFDFATCVTFLKRVRAALKPGGTAATVEFVPNEDRVSPPMPASFALQMLGATPAGDAYTLRELEAMHREAGFSYTSASPLEPTPQTLFRAS